MEKPNKTIRKFWNWTNAENGRTLYFDGVIAEETWLGDEITPKKFKDELFGGEGEVTIWLNSPGGDVYAAAQIYNMLMDYGGKVTVKIDGLAASAASVIAMAGGEVFMSPVSMMMIHNPATIAIGDTEEMSKAIEMLTEVKESIINAYELKTGLSRPKLSHMMDAETWMNANKAIELKFADSLLFSENEEPQHIPDSESSMIFSRQAITNSLLCKIAERSPKQKGTPIEPLYKRLTLIKPKF